jgi:hypothetical protein
MTASDMAVTVRLRPTVVSVTTKFLMGLAVAVALLTLGLGAAGWAARGDAKAKHQAAIEAKHQAKFCRELKTVILPLTGGLGTDVPFDIPPELKNQDLTEQARFLVYRFDTLVIPDAPPVLKEPLRTVSDAADEASHDLSVAPFSTAEVQRAIKEVVDWYAEGC